MASSDDDIESLEEKIDILNLKEGSKSLTKVSYENTEENCGVNDGQDKQDSKVFNVSDETNQDSGLRRDHKKYIQNYSSMEEKSQSGRIWRQSEARGSFSSQYVKLEAEENKPMLNWRDHRSQYSLINNKIINKEKPSNILSWRDPEFRWSNVPHQYENNHVKDRTKTPNDRIGYKAGSKDKVGHTVASHDIISLTAPAYDKNLTREGYFSIICDTITVDNEGGTELDKVWNTIYKINSEIPGLFVRQPCKNISKTHDNAAIYCYTFDYCDKLHVANVSKILREKLRFYKFTIIYYGNYKSLYMSTYDGELYEKDSHGWKYVNKDLISE